MLDDAYNGYCSCKCLEMKILFATVNYEIPDQDQKLLMYKVGDGRKLDEENLK